MANRYVGPSPRPIECLSCCVFLAELRGVNPLNRLQKLLMSLCVVVVGQFSTPALAYVVGGSAWPG